MVLAKDKYFKVMYSLLICLCVNIAVESESSSQNTRQTREGNTGTELFPESVISLARDMTQAQENPGATMQRTQERRLANTVKEVIPQLYNHRYKNKQEHHNQLHLKQEIGHKHKRFQETEHKEDKKAKRVIVKFCN